MNKQRATFTRPEEYFFTHIRKVEAVGSECIRLFCAVERNGGWEDQVTLIMPYASVFPNTRFVIEAATEIHNEAQLKVPKVGAH